MVPKPLMHYYREGLLVGRKLPLDLDPCSLTLEGDRGHLSKGVHDLLTDVISLVELSMSLRNLLLLISSPTILSKKRESQSVRGVPHAQQRLLCTKRRS